MIRKISHREESAGLIELSNAQERVLIECLRTLDAGHSVDECLANYPQHADSIRRFLSTRARLRELRVLTPAPAAISSGRDALLATLIRPYANGHPVSTGPSRSLANGLVWPRVARAAGAGALLLVVASSAFGYSAADGVARARDAMDSLPEIELPEQTPYLWPPKYNSAPTITPETAEDTTNAPIAEQQVAPSTAPDASGDGTSPSVAPEAAPQDVVPPTTPGDKPSAKPDDASDDFWQPPYNAEEPTPEDLPEASTPPPPPDEEDCTEQSDNADDEADVIDASGSDKTCIGDEGQPEDDNQSTPPGEAKADHKG
jgi:hypothetical protein